MSNPSINWEAINNDPRFQALHKRKTIFLWSLMFFSIVFYFCLPIGAAYWPELFKIKVWGPINIGITFALMQFIVAWLIAFIYARRANRIFDELAQELIDDYESV